MVGRAEQSWDSFIKGITEMNKLVIFLCLLPLFAPMPWGLALNHQTKECAGFWGGDEYGSFTSPADWDIYYPDQDNIIHTEIGTCSFYQSRRYEAAESCCEELPYTYVNPNIGEPNRSILLILLAWAVGLVGLIIVAIFLVIGVIIITVIVISTVIVTIRKRRRKNS